MISPLQDESPGMLPPNVSVSCPRVAVHITQVLLQFISPPFSLPTSISSATHGCPNYQCCTTPIVHSTADVTCPCPFSALNYFHNVHNFSLVHHPLASFLVFISDVRHVSLLSLLVVLCWAQFQQRYCAEHNFSNVSVLPLDIQSNVQQFGRKLNYYKLPSSTRI